MSSDRPPYQLRVMVERDELHERTEKLAAFLRNDAFAPFFALDPAERERMVRQLDAMGALLSILNERIRAFTP